MKFEFVPQIQTFIVIFHWCLGGNLNETLPNRYRYPPLTLTKRTAFCSTAQCVLYFSQGVTTPYYPINPIHGVILPFLRIRSFNQISLVCDYYLGDDIQLSSFCLPMVGLQPSSSMLCVAPLRRNWAIFCHTCFGLVGRVWSAREKSFKILRHGWELNPGHWKNIQWDSFLFPLSYNDWSQLSINTQIAIPLPKHNDSM